MVVGKEDMLNRALHRNRRILGHLLSSGRHRYTTDWYGHPLRYLAPLVQIRGKNGLCSGLGHLAVRPQNHGINF